MEAAPPGVGKNGDNFLLLSHIGNFCKSLKTDEKV